MIENNLIALVEQLTYLQTQVVEATNLVKDTQSDLKAAKFDLEKFIAELPDTIRELVIK